MAEDIWTHLISSEEEFVSSAREEKKERNDNKTKCNCCLFFAFRLQRSGQFGKGGKKKQKTTFVPGLKRSTKSLFSWKKWSKILKSLPAFKTAICSWTIMLANSRFVRARSVLRSAPGQLRWEILKQLLRHNVASLSFLELVLNIRLLWFSWRFFSREDLDMWDRWLFRLVACYPKFPPCCLPPGPKMRGWMLSDQVKAPAWVIQVRKASKLLIPAHLTEDQVEYSRCSQMWSFLSL